MNDTLHDKPEARAILGGIGSTKFHQLLASGELSGCKIGRRTFIKRSELDRYLASLPSYQAGT
jgi:excisionase family DNA binding protein